MDGGGGWGRPVERYGDGSSPLLLSLTVAIVEEVGTGLAQRKFGTRSTILVCRDGGEMKEIVTSITLRYFYYASEAPSTNSKKCWKEKLSPLLESVCFAHDDGFALCSVALQRASNECYIILMYEYIYIQI